MWRLYVLILSLTFVRHSAIAQIVLEDSSQKFVGDFCRNPNGNGTCQPINNCPTLKKRTIRTLTRCGFEGQYSIICCPNGKVPSSVELNERALSGVELSGKAPSGVKLSGKAPSGVELTISERISSVETENERISTKECRRMSDENPSSITSFIIDGEEAEENEFPHMAMLGYRLSDSNELGFLCGGTLISNRFVLTAAHCTNNRLGNLTMVRLGEASPFTKNTENSDFTIENTIIHPNYINRYNYYDIALLRLDRDVPFSVNIFPACLYNDSRDITTKLTVTGWGKTDVNGPNSFSKTLMKATVSPVNNTYCRTFYSSPEKRIPMGLTKDQICAVDATADTCQGDSGGPLQIKISNLNMYSVVGITSFGKSCGSNVPAVYTRVSKYLDWIESQVWPQTIPDLLGTACENPTGSGVCRLIKNCPRAQNRKIWRTLKTCEFNGNDTTICCPNLESGNVSEIQDERISSRECRIMSNIVPKSTTTFIIGGKEVEENEFPHMAALGYQNTFETQLNLTTVKFACGGSLISRRYVLTAAHCAKTELGNLTIVRMGELTLSNYTAVSDFGIENIIVHPNYNFIWYYDDIALLRLNRDVSYTPSISPACLHNDPRQVISRMIIIGWGSINPDSNVGMNNDLMKATVTSVNNNQCNSSFRNSRRVPKGLSNGQMCASDETSDTCYGDSGGPLQIHNPEFDISFVVGITSFGRYCGLNIPSVYTKVSEYLDWIESHVWTQLIPDLPKGAECSNPIGPGVCRLAKKCSRSQNRAIWKSIRTCGFDGNDTIICCPKL